MDYETKTTLAYLNGHFYPTEKVNISVGGSYSLSEASFAAVEMETPETVTAHGNYDYSEINTFSDLKFSQIEAWAKGVVEVYDRTSVYLGVGYYDLQDDEPYIYGDQSGDVAYVQSGLKVVF